jgi:cyclophilin family peptidyl-prolyl cis-trans isomerase
MMKNPFRQIPFWVAFFILSSLACQALGGGTEAPPATQAEPPAIVETGLTPGLPYDASEYACEPFSDIPAAAQYPAPPEVVIDTLARYTATIRMAKGGEIFIELYDDQAPITVNNFVFLACKGFYDGTTFHRVLPEFMAQAGDPTGTGMGGPGYEFINEYSDLTFSKPGVLAMANAGPDTNGSQFFITFVPAPWLDGGFTIFGKVLQGMDVVSEITLRDPDANPSFQGDIIEQISIQRN